MRQKRIVELHEDIETVDKVISCLESERAKLVNMQKYSQAAQVLQQMGEKRKEKRQLSNQLTTIQAKEAKSKSYHKNKKISCTKSKSVSDARSDSQKVLRLFFAKSGNTGSRNINACGLNLVSNSRVDPKVVVVEDTECHGSSGSSNFEDSEDVVFGSESCAPSTSIGLKDSEDMVDELESSVPTPSTGLKDNEVSNGSLVDYAILYPACNEEIAQSSDLSDQNNAQTRTTSPLEESVSDNKISSRKVDFLCL